MDWPTESLIAAAERSIAPDQVPTELIRSYLTLFGVVPSEREKHEKSISAFLDRRNSVSTLASDLSSTVFSSNQSSKRNTQYSFASTNTSYSGFSTRSAPSIPPPVPKLPANIPFSANITEKVPDERIDGPIGSSRARSQTRDDGMISRVLASRNQVKKNKPPQSSKPKPFICPWCNTSCGRAHDFRAHIKNYCGSQTVWICERCGNRAQSRTQAHKHRFEENCGDCKPFPYLEKRLDYTRTAYGCRHYAGKCFHSLEVYMDHLVDNCQIGRVSGTGDRSLQLRNLLYQPLLIGRVEELCRKKWGSVSAMPLLRWDLPEKEITDRVERLEYGVRDLDDGELNCGIASEDVEAFLVDLIDWSILESNGNTIDYSSLHKALPKPPKPVAEHVPDWLNDVHENLPSTTLTTPNGLGTLLLEETGEAHLQPNTSSLKHRQKRPISDNSRQHPESTSRYGINPFSDNLTDTAGRVTGIEIPHLVDLDSYLWVPMENQLSLDDNTVIPPPTFGSCDDIVTEPIVDLPAIFTERNMDPANDLFSAIDELLAFDYPQDISGSNLNDV